jgi:hypothetical protein
LLSDLPLVYLYLAIGVQDILMFSMLMFSMLLLLLLLLLLLRFLAGASLSHAGGVGSEQHAHWYLRGHLEQLEILSVKMYR